MATIVIGKTQKPINSTSRVFYAGGTTISGVRLKEPCSMQAPIFLLQGLDKETCYNFLKWNCTDFDRYYWIEDIIYITNDIQEVHCRLDPLATFREAIKDNNVYVRYGSSNNWNQHVDDIRMQPEKQGGFVKSTYFDMFHDANTNKTLNVVKNGGVVAIRVMESCSHDILTKLQQMYTGKYDNFNENLHRGVNTYIIDYNYFTDWVLDLTETLQEVVHDCFTRGSTTDYAMEYAQASAKMAGAIMGAGNWRDNIISCIYLPITFSSIRQLNLGSDDIGFCCGGVPAAVDCYKLNSPISVWAGRQDLGVALPWNTTVTAKPGQSDLQSGKYSFLRNNRWADFQVVTPGGVQSLPTDLLKDNDKIGVWSSLNLCTGEWTMRMTDESGGYGINLATFGGSIGVNLTEFLGTGENYYSQAEAYAAQLISQVASAIVQAYTSIPIGQAITTNHKKTSAPAIDAAGNPTTKRVIEQSDYETTRDVCSSGINMTFIPSGVNKQAPVSSMSGNISDLFVVDGGAGYGSDFGKCQIINIQYVPHDLAGYAGFCEKEGFPVNKWCNLKTDDCTGYTVCSMAYVTHIYGATQTNLSTINSFLNSGIVIEE